MMAQDRLSRGTLVPTAFLLLIATIAFTALASASPTPPPSGDWTIEAAENITLTGQDLTLPGGVYVYGHLTLNNCTLRFAPATLFEKPLWVEGQLDAVDTSFTTTTDTPVYITGRGSSLNTFTGCTFACADVRFQGTSHNAFTGCTFADGFGATFNEASTNTFTTTDFTSVYLKLDADTQNTATGCTFCPSGWTGTTGNAQSTFSDCAFDGDGFHFSSPSDTVLERCSFADSVWTTLQLEGDTALALSDAAPGHQVATVIASSNDSFRLELRDTTVNGFFLRAYDTTRLTVERSTIGVLQCSNRNLTELIDSHLDRLSVMNWNVFHTPCPPIGLTVDGFRDGAAPQTLDITTDDPLLPVLVSLQNTTVLTSLWEFADGGDPPTPTSSAITNSFIDGASVTQHSSLLVADTEFAWGGLGAAVGPENVTDANAQLTLEDCEVTHLALYGADTTVTLRRSSVSGKVVFGHSWMSEYANTTPWAPSLVLDSASFIPGYDPRVYVDAEISGAQVSGVGEVHFCRTIADWALGSTVIRSYPVLVKDPDGAPVVGAPVRAADVYGTVVWSGTTDAEGYAYPEATFDDSNHSTE
ncbi:MAG: carboxypeptidase regulatory-like domain-containing protein, partial [Armatimonadota bacterium]